MILWCIKIILINYNDNYIQYVLYDDTQPYLGQGQTDQDLCYVLYFRKFSIQNHLTVHIEKAQKINLRWSFLLKGLHDFCYN